MEDKRCYTVKEVQAILGISRPTVYMGFGKKRICRRLRLISQNGFL